MASMARPAESCQEIALLLNIGRIFREMALLLKTNETERDLQRFYSHLMAFCLLVSDQVNRVKTALRPENPLIHRLLDLFQSLTTVHIAQKLSNLQICTSYPRLWALDHYWSKIADQSSETKVDFIRSCLDFGSNPARRDALTDFLEKWVDDLLEVYPEDSSQWSKEDCLPQRKKRSEPSYAVWAAAQALYEALLASKNCTCHPTHDYGARLCLGTYRKPSLEDSHALIEDFDFDMFLALEKFWQEVHVHTKKETMVRFVLNAELEQAMTKKAKASRMKVKELCKPIEKIKAMSPYRRLKFEVENRQLFKLESDESKSPFDRTKTPVSLAQFIEERSYTLTEKTKRILALLLSYAVLHLYGTTWLQSSWGSSNIVFLQTKSSSIPLKPFIQAQLVQDHGSSSLVASKACQLDEDGELDPDDIDRDDIDPDDIDPDDLLPHHQCPCLVTLAIMLMEVYLATPFQTLGAKYEVKLSDGSDNNLRYLEVLQVFQHCKFEIPENSQFRSSLNNCLDMNLWQDENSQPLKEQTMRSVMYQEVVRPLEDELDQAFSYISIDELDSIVQTLDLSWGQTIQDQQLIGVQHPMGSNRFWEALGRSQFMAGFQQNIQHQRQAWRHPESDGLRMALKRKREACQEADYTSFKFFDDESRPEEISDDAREQYQDWKSDFLAVYDFFITRHLAGKDPATPVKIAVLDTGIDLQHPEIDALRDRIKGFYNFVNDKYREDVQDRNGHGTHVAGLLLSYAQDAELFVAKIADKKPSNPRIIAEAINHAITSWDVDIISMSFGFPNRNIPEYFALEKAIEDAYNKHILLFAAASNSGANLHRVYPARHEQVICIHSTDSTGNRSKFSPTAIDGDNFATIGEAVESARPMHLCGPAIMGNSLVTHKCGTSYATPIAAGIAAFLLQYARLHFNEEQAKMLKKSSAMKAVLRRIAAKREGAKKRDDYDYVQLSRYADNLFGKEERHVWSEVLDAVLHS